MLVVALSLTGLLDSASSAALEPLAVSSRSAANVVEGDANKGYSQPVDKSQVLLISLKATAKQLTIITWNKANWKAYKRLVWLESRWNYRAYNEATTAYGLGQLIGSKRYLKDKPYKQIVKSLQYIHSRYGSPIKALKHLEREGWH